MAENKLIRQLSEFKFIKFYDSLKINDYKSLNVTEDNLLDLRQQFLKELNFKQQSTDKQINNINKDINILKSLILIYLHEKEDDETNAILKRHGIVIDDNVDKTIENITLYIEALDSKLDFLDSQKPLELRVNFKSGKKVTGHSMLGSLSVSLEMNLGKFTEVTVMEYISYRLALIEKNENIEAVRLKNKTI